MKAAKILPETGRGTAHRAVEGHSPTHQRHPAIHSQTCDCWRCLDARQGEYVSLRTVMPIPVLIASLMLWALIGAAIHLIARWLGFCA